MARKSTKAVRALVTSQSGWRGRVQRQLELVYMHTCRTCDHFTTADKVENEGMKHKFTVTIKTSIKVN